MKKVSARKEASARDQNQQVTMDSSVLDSLCKNAVETKDPEFREALLDILKCNAEEAHKRFIDYAIHSPDPIQRRWALVNLSLMECKTAKEAVLSGLMDPNGEVRIAAAMNAGLYDDPKVLAALEHFFATNRFACVRNFARLIVRQLRQNKRSKMTLDVACLQDVLHSPSVPSV
ncbi:MAG: HEAT repeat domain-containing protein [Desulfobacterales bacterium]|nr:HEAT repeat domain-containing protein [Desulfobacterales bacterium]